MRKANISDLPKVAALLTNAFWDNKSVNYVVRQDERKHERMLKLMAYSFHACMTYGEVLISDDENACALLLFPDKKKTTLGGILWDVKLAISVIGLSRVVAVMKRETSIKNSHPNEPFCHLWFIGVNPDLQGKGKGSQILKSIIDNCKKDNRDIYLETSVETNLNWYKKFGFEIFNTIELTYTLYQLRLSSKS